MSDTWFISDPHFGHASMLKFLRQDGALLRPQFANVDEMDDFIITQHNSVVKPDDKVYILGDIAMKKRFLEKVLKLNGRKRIILGNHDIFGYKEYARYFGEVYHMRTLPGEGILMTHIPIHIQSVKRGWVNVHGHLHAQIVAQDQQMIEGTLADQHPKYYSVCVEQHNYTPVNMDIIRDKVKALKIDALT